jgi:putative hemolysin
MQRTLQWLMAIGMSVSACVAIALPNPASVYCGKHGGTSVLIKNTGICVFDRMYYCEEWAFFKGKCQRGDIKLPEKLSRVNAKQYCKETIADQIELVKCKVL